ncbi:MAG: DUF2795 domain-containing protein [Actinomycetota bacterium]|nr:DUF2795 domain-containing protein [Actinomycetota bacterium]
MEEQTIQQHLQNISFPADKDQIVSALQEGGAPEDMVSDVQDNLPDGEYSDPQQVVSKLSPGRASGTE